jgi:hypothetical protein
MESGTLRVKNVFLRSEEGKNQLGERPSGKGRGVNVAM